MNHLDHFDSTREAARVRTQLPRTKYTHLTDRELARLTEFEQASVELFEEHNARRRWSAGRST